jgi:hypothetical protein
MHTWSRRRLGAGEIQARGRQHLPDVAAFTYRAPDLLPLQLGTKILLRGKPTLEMMIMFTAEVINFHEIPYEAQMKRHNRIG